METTPSLYLLRGDDLNRFREVISGFKAGLGDPDMADLNTTILDGDSLSYENLHADAMTMPFLAPRRLVVIEKARNFLARFNKDNRTKVVELFETLPETTALVLLVEDQQTRKRGERYWEHGRSYDWTLDWVRQHSDRAILVDCSLPDVEEMPAWILRKAKERGGGFRPDAAHLLASYVGNDTLRAQQEIDKLLAYAGKSGVVGPEDVTLLTAQNQEGNIFTLTDALGERNGPRAMQQFLLLTANSDLMEITGMIHRQFRLLIQAREILDEGGQVPVIEMELNVPNFVARKLIDQARRFNMRQLLDIYTRLLKIDEDMKSGGMPGDVAFELLIADLTR